MAISAESTAGGEPAPKSWWLYLLLGIVFIIGGFIVLGDVTLASVISAIVIAWALLIVGVIQVVHAFSATGWKGFLLDLLVGALYIAAGYILLANPLAATLKLTLILALFGLFRECCGLCLPPCCGEMRGGFSSSPALSASLQAASSYRNGHDRGFGSWAFFLALTFSSMASPG